MKTILLIDDEEPIRRLVRSTLAGRSCEVIEAASGPAGLELAKKVRPDVLVLDLRMPGMSGVEVAKALKDDEDTKNIPVIMLTASDPLEFSFDAVKSWIFSFMLKPFRPLALVQEVEKAIGPV